MSTKYGLVKDGEVVKMSSKPTSPRVSNLWLNESAMAEEGWLPIDDKKPRLKPWQKLGARSEEVLKTKINFNYEVVETPLEKYKEKKIKELSKKASEAIYSQGAPVYKQLNAALGIYETGKQDNVNKVIKDVRKEHEDKEKTILKAKTYEDVDAVYIGITSFMPKDQVDKNGWPIPQEDIV